MHLRVNEKDMLRLLYVFLYVVENVIQFSESISWFKQHLKQKIEREIKV